MRRTAIAVALLSLLESGCYTVRVQAPPGTHVYLSDSPPEGGTESGSTTHVFLVSGLAPVNDNSTAGLVKPGCRSVAFVTEMTFTDGLISFAVALGSGFLWGLIASSAGNASIASIASIGAGVTSVFLIPHLRTTTAYCTDRRYPPAFPVSPPPSQPPADAPTQPTTPPPSTSPSTPQQPPTDTKP